MRICKKCNKPIVEYAHAYEVIIGKYDRTEDFIKKQYDSYHADCLEALIAENKSENKIWEMWRKALISFTEEMEHLTFKFLERIKQLDIDSEQLTKSEDNKNDKSKE